MGFALRSIRGFQVMASAAGARGMRERYEPKLSISSYWDGSDMLPKKLDVPAPPGLFDSEEAAIAAALDYANTLIEAEERKRSSRTG